MKPRISFLVNSTCLHAPCFPPAEERPHLASNYIQICISMLHCYTLQCPFVTFVSHNCIQMEWNWDDLWPHFNSCLALSLFPFLPTIFQISNHSHHSHPPSHQQLLWKNSFGADWESDDESAPFGVGFTVNQLSRIAIIMLISSNNLSYFQSLQNLSQFLESHEQLLAL